MGTKLDKEIEEATNIEGNVRDELSVLQIRLHFYPDIRYVCEPSKPCHSFLAQVVVVVIFFFFFSFLMKGIFVIWGTLIMKW
jgi:hypothetical protein